MQDFFLKFLLIILELGAFLDNLLKENIISIFAEHPLSKFSVFGGEWRCLAGLFFLEVLADDLTMLFPKFLF